ncbi:MAG: glycosyltransferase [Myxococcota bacterium]
MELCLVDDASRNPEVVRALDALGKEAGVRLRRLPENQGIAAATNAAIELATGDFLVFVDHDDALSQDALSRVAQACRWILHSTSSTPIRDVVDEEDSSTGLLQARLVAELLLAYMCVGHLKVVRTSLARRLSSLRPGFEGAADYDFMLRLAERTDRVHHLPEVLYHWRAAVNSIARHSDAKTHARRVRPPRAVTETLEQQGIPAAAEWPAWAQRIRTGVYRTRHAGGAMGRVTILIPTRDRVDLLRDCIASIEDRTDYDDWEILVLDNDSRDAETLDYLAKTPHQVLRVPGPFNFSRIVNRGVEASRSEFVLLLNNDTLVASTDWLTEMVGTLRLPSVGAVGAKLLYLRTDRIQHAGVTMGVHGLTGHAFEDAPGPLRPDRDGVLRSRPRNVGAVTACLLTPSRPIGRSAGSTRKRSRSRGTTRISASASVRGAGGSWWAPLAELIHLCSASGATRRGDREVGVMFERWSRQIDRDPTRIRTGAGSTTTSGLGPARRAQPLPATQPPASTRRPADTAGDERGTMSPSRSMRSGGHRA